MQEKILNILLNEEELSWKNILFELVNSEQMDPWDIDVTLLAKKYIEIIKQMQEHDLRVSGKIVLAAAFLLRIKSTHFVEKDFANIDRLFNQGEGLEEEFLDDLELQDKVKGPKQKFQLIPKNPQPRNRKVSIHDLVQALQRAMETKKRILAKQRPVPFNYTKRKMDIVSVIYDLYHKIVYYTNKKEQDTLTFSELLPPKAGKQEKVYTFVPLLHLENQRKVETTQAKPFDEIYIKLAGKKKE